MGAVYLTRRITPSPTTSRRPISTSVCSTRSSAELLSLGSLITAPIPSNGLASIRLSRPSDLITAWRKSFGSLLAIFAAIRRASSLPRASLMHGNPLVPGLQAQAETGIINAQIPVRAGPNCLGHDRCDLLRHHPDVGRVAPQVPIAI